ncbi:MAG TPA: hypothetical protein VF950_06245 [Planctomycetota bacterium]
MASEGPRMEAKGTARVGGRVSEIAVSADAARLLVFHDDEAKVTGLDAARLDILGHDRLGPGEPTRRFFLGGRGDLFYCAAPGSGLAVFDASQLRFTSTLSCAMRPVDIRFLPDGERAFLALENGEDGAVERRIGGNLGLAGRLEFRGRPVPESLTYCPRLGLGAVLVRRPEGAVDLFLWRLEPFEAFLSVPIDGAANALAFSPTRDLLFVSRPERREVVALSVPSGEVSRRITMLGGAVQLAPQPEDAGVWALSEGIAHLVRVDLPLGAGPAPVRLEGFDVERNRLRLSPEGRLGVLPLQHSGQLLLVDARSDSRGASSVADLLETGRPLSRAAWSPLGDAFYVAGIDGSVSAFAVNRGNWDLRDSNDYLAARPASKYPLFPP